MGINNYKNQSIPIYSFLREEDGQKYWSDTQVDYLGRLAEGGIIYDNVNGKDLVADAEIWLDAPEASVVKLNDKVSYENQNYLIVRREVWRNKNGQPHSYYFLAKTVDNYD